MCVGGGMGSLLNHHQCAASTWMMWRLTQDNGAPHTSYRWRGERDIEPIKSMHSPHTSYRWRGERDIEPIKWIGIIRRPWLTRASGGNLARTPLLFTRSAMGFFNDHRESGPRFNVSSERQCFLTVQCPRHYTGGLEPTQTRGRAPPAGLTNTSSSSNLVFPGGLPSRYWPAQPCLASVGDWSWAAGWYVCR